jgi:putative nucleotidyltransferase with HDIG domain
MEQKATVDNLTGVTRRNLGPSRWLPVYTTTISLFGGLIVLVALLRFPEDIVGLALFAGMAALAELANVELPSSSHSRVSVSSVVGIASIMAFGPLAGAFVHVASGLTTLITTTLLSRRPKAGRVSLLRRAAFNIGMYVTASAVAGATYVLLGGSCGNVGQLTNVLPLAAAATVDVLVNLLILIEVITLQTRKTPLEIWKANFQWAAPIAIAGNIFGGILALAYEMFEYLGLAVFLLPILATSYSFRLYVSNSKVYVDQLEKVNKNLDDANMGLLETLGAVIDAYDMYTFGHSTQVAVYAGEMATRLGMSSEEHQKIVKAALVHDLGKVSIYDSIIRKKGRLTDEEFNLLKRHPAIGAEIISRMKGLQDIVPMVRHHHERYDGLGYPDGLAGEEIPLGARILCVADSVDAMFSDRPYRPTRSYKEVMSEIAACSGSQFDPRLVEVFFQMAEEMGRGFFKNSAAVVDKAVQIEGVSLLGRMDRHMKKSMIPEKEHPPRIEKPAPPENPPEEQA